MEGNQTTTPSSLTTTTGEEEAPKEGPEESSTPETTLTAATTQSIGKCNKRGCSHAHLVPLVCVAPQCSKTRHWECFQATLGAKPAYSVELSILKEGEVVCTKECLKKVINLRTKKVNWTNDSSEGKSSPNGTSMHLLIQWISVPGNYSKWRGDKDHQGRKKKEVAKTIADFINAGGVVEKRTPAQVQAQMSRLESNMRQAYDFACTETGAGLMETDKISFDEAVRKKCSYYFDLKEIMCERASITPKVTSDETLDSSDEEIEGGAIRDVTLGLSDDSDVEEVEEVDESSRSDRSTPAQSQKKKAPSSSAKKAKVCYVCSCLLQLLAV